MTTKQIVDNFRNTVVDTIQSAYTAPSDKSVIIEAFTATNNSIVDASYKAYITSDGGEVKPIRPFKIVVWGELDLGNGIANQAIPPGGSLSFETSALESIDFTVTGRIVSLAT